jgi:hypothetical protein
VRIPEASCTLFAIIASTIQTITTTLFVKLSRLEDPRIYAIPSVSKSNFRKECVAFFCLKSAVEVFVDVKNVFSFWGDEDKTGGR